MAIGDKELDRDNMNKALAVLIAKVDRRVPRLGREVVVVQILLRVREETVSAGVEGTLRSVGRGQ